MRAHPDEYPTSGPVSVIATEPLCCNCDADSTQL